MSSIHAQIEEQVQAYLAENAKFETGNKAAGTRARKALGELAKLCKERRKEIQAIKNGE